MVDDNDWNSDYDEELFMVQATIEEGWQEADTELELKAIACAK